MHHASSSSYARSLIEASLDPLVTINANGKIMDVNRATEKVTGIQREKLIGSDFCNYFTEPQKARDGYQLAFSQGIVTDYPLAICHATGSITHVLYNAAVFRDDNGDIAGLFAAARDVTALKKAQQKLEEAVLQMEVIREMSELLQSCQRKDEAYPIIGSALQRLLPESSGGIYVVNVNSNSLMLVNSWGQEELEMVFTLDECWAMRRGRLHLGLTDSSLNPKCQHVKQNTIPYACIPLIAHSHGLGLIYIQSNPDISEQAEIRSKVAIAETAADSASLALANLILREELRLLSIRDPLTGLYNRRFLEEALERELVRMNRAGKTLAVAMIDIDHFKSFNDRYGHDAGDEILKNAAKLMLAFRNGNDIVCRYGGEEFVVVLTEVEPEIAVERFERLRESIEKLPVNLGTPDQVQVTISIGIAVYPQHGNNRLELLIRADQALYLAKAAGRNRVFLAQ